MLQQVHKKHLDYIIGTVPDATNYSYLVDAAATTQASVALIERKAEVCTQVPVPSLIIVRTHAKIHASLISCVHPRAVSRHEGMPETCNYPTTSLKA